MGSPLFRNTVICTIRYTLNIDLDKLEFTR